MTVIEHGSATTEWPESSSRVVRWTVVVGYGLALAAFVMAFVGSDLRLASAAVDAFPVMVLVAVPPTLAMLSHPDRPLLLLPAGLTGLLGLFYVLSIWGWGLALLGVLWLVTYLQVAPAGHWLRKLAMLAVPLLFLAGTTMLWIHLDPACEQRLRDGTVTDIDPTTRGFESGWVWETDTGSFSSSGTISGDVVYEACASDTRVLWESGAATLLAAGAVLLGWALAARGFADKS